MTRRPTDNAATSYKYDEATDRFVPSSYRPISFRSMGWLERKLRLFAGSGWNGEHPTGYGWARALLAVGERLWWK